MAVLASDNFDRANNADIGTSWTVITSEGAFKIVSNAAEPTSVSSDAMERYSGIAWPNDQYAQAVVTPNTTGPVSSDVGIGVCVRAASGARTYYRLVADASDATQNITLAKMSAATYTTLWLRSQAIAAGNVLRLEVVGTTLRAYINGVQVGADTTDGVIASGDAGIAFSSTVTSSSLDNWEGGDFATGLTPAQAAVVLAGQGIRLGFTINMPDEL